MRADLVLPRWLVHRWAERSARIDVGVSLRAESFVPAAPTGSAVAIVRGAAVTERYGAQPMDERIERLFVYGTLQPGRLRWPFLARFAIGHRPAEVSGTIYDTGYGWPVAVFGPSAESVPGTLVDLDGEHLGEALRCSTTSRPRPPTCCGASP